MKFIRKMLFFVPDSILMPLVFELRSTLARILTKELKTDPTKKNYINLGCGTTIAKGFINIDFFSCPGIDYGADLRYPLRIPDACIDGIFSEHTFEHLSYATNQMLFKECYRILKTGGIFRIVLPDVSLFLKNYADNNQSWFKKWEQLMFTESLSPERARRRLSTPLEAVSFITQEYGHLSAWDCITLKVYLERAGFQEITKTSFMEGEDKKLFLDSNSEDRKFVSLYLEARK